MGKSLVSCFFLRHSVHAFRLNQRHFILTKNTEQNIFARNDVIRYVITVTGLCISCWCQFLSDVPKTPTTLTTVNAAGNGKYQTP